MCPVLKNHYFPVVRLIIFCDSFGLNLFDYLVDPNSPATSPQGDNETTSLSLVRYDGEDNPRNFIDMHLEILELRKQLFDTKQEISILRRNQNPNTMIENEIKTPVTFLAEFVSRMTPVV